MLSRIFLRYLKFEIIRYPCCFVRFECKTDANVIVLLFTHLRPRAMGELPSRPPPRATLTPSPMLRVWNLHKNTPLALEN